MAPPLSETSPIPNQSKCIFVQNEYLEGAASIPENTFFPEAPAIH